MTTDSLNTKELFTSLDETSSELLKLMYSADELTINTIPFKDSWTAAQLAVHITKSNKAIVQGLNMQGKPAERNPEEGVPHLKKMFLDFNARYQSPEFIIPEQGNYKKESVIAALKKSIGQLQDVRTKVNLLEMITLPIFGEITKLELLHFVLYHTTRHVHQLKNILKKLNQKINN